MTRYRLTVELESGLTETAIEDIAATSFPDAEVSVLQIRDTEGDDGV
jgi:hypothetical protein